jgi:hypothetical protein
MFFETQYPIVIDPGFLRDDKRKFRFSTPDAYYQAVYHTVINIGNTKVGDILLRSIKWHGKLVRIAPVPPFDETTCGGADASHGEDQDLSYNRTVGKRIGLPIRVVIRFNPHWHQYQGNCHKKHIANEDYAATPESVLIHELVHALRKISNKEKGTLDRLGKGWDYGEAEEFFAVLVENIYQSEVKGNIRRSHPSGFRNLDKQFEGSFEFFQVTRKAFEYVDIFCRENAGLTRALAKLKVPFNPIAAYYQNPGKARQMSNSPVAVGRDL